MLLKLIHFLASRLDVREIKGRSGDTVYLYRYRIFGWLPGDKPKRYGLYLHRFMRPDDDEHLHSHPWDYAVSLVLAGGYTEERFPETCSVCDNPKDGKHRVRRVIRPGRLNILRGEAFHRVSELHGRETWTLFFVGPKRASWGFFVPGRGVVNWKEYLDERS